MKTYTGGCHCKSVQYEVEMEPTEVMECNCSHCAIKGFLLTFVPREQFKLLKGKENLTSYKFNKMHIDHLFCKTCGVESFAHGSDGQGNEMAAINLRCVGGIDLEILPRKPYNGKDY